MNLRVLVPMAASLALLAAVPASAATHGHYRPVVYGSSEQGGGGAGPYDPRCQSFRNYNQRQACTSAVEGGLQYRPSDESGPLGFLEGLMTGGDAEQGRNVQLNRG